VDVDFKWARFCLKSGVTILIKDGNSGVSAVSIDFTPAPESLIRLTDDKIVNKRNDVIRYPPKNLSVRCSLLENIDKVKVLNVSIGPYQVQDVEAIVNHIMRVPV
jgi:hypothetical protein